MAKSSDQPIQQRISKELGDVSIKDPGYRIMMADLYRESLLEDILPFWFPRCLDQEHGGFFSCLDRDGSIFETDKSVWIQGRMVWMLLRCYQDLEANPAWLEWAESGLGFLNKHGFDTDGRMFFQLTREGKPIRKRRYAYSEAFAAIAYAAHARTTGNSASADRAEKLLAHFIRWNFESPAEFSPKFTDERPLIGLTPRMITLVTALELNHQLGSNPHRESVIEQMVTEILEWFVKPELGCVLETAHTDGTVSDHLEGRTLNPGHAIEAAWFVMEAGTRQGRKDWIKGGCQMLEMTWKRSWDTEHGGLLYFTDIYNKPVQEYWHDMKFWWPHDETMIASIMAYQLTGEAKYASIHQAVHDWSFKHFTDPVHGEWYGYLHRDGSIANTAKGNLWKSFFHHPRSLIVCSDWLRKESKAID
ncbi:MAG: AGE family epimerase/isomerase [Verrucomicrobia bacterium]|nr:AGE family epimerase/isomerase [Verrucomicrobiota bacterium]